MYYDPIAYRFHFTCADESIENEKLTNALRQFIDELDEYIIAFAMNGSYIDVSYNEIGSTWSNGYTFNGKYGLSAWQVYKEAINTRSFYRASITSIHKYVSGRKLARPKSTQQEEIDRILRMIIQRSRTDSEIDELKEEMCSFINCRTDDLDDLAYSKEDFDTYPLKIQYSTRDIFEKMFTIITDDTPESKKLHKHVLNIELPRFLFKKGFPFEKVWTERLKELAGSFKWCYGSVTMDAFRTDWELNINEEQDKIYYFGKHLPGYAWASCYGKAHYDLLTPETKDKCKRELFRFEQTDNGSLFTQITDSIHRLPRTANNICASLFAPYLPDQQGYTNRNTLFSFRTSVSKNALSLDQICDRTQKRFSLYSINLKETQALY